jgi:hypothetical protein
LLDLEELKAKENLIKTRYDEVIAIENKIEWNVSYQGSTDDEYNNSSEDVENEVSVEEEEEN